MKALFVTVQNTPAGLELAAFPFKDEQHIDSETPIDADQTLVEIDLDGANDTDGNQEQYLNTNPHVVGYEIR